jgi:putative ABC transport system permease protein
MSELWRRLRFLFQRRFDSDLEEEMRFHLAMRAEEERENGIAPEEAQYAARRAFGSAMLLRETSRDLWGWAWLDRLVQDLRYAARVLRKNPGFTAAAVLTIALAIGANTAVFSLLEAVVLRPLPYPEPDRLVTLWTVESKTQYAMNSSYPDFRDWEQQNHVFQSMAAFAGGSLNLTGGAEPQLIDSLRITSRMFEVLGVRPALGRTFSETEGERVAVISHRLWLRRFGADRNIIGRSIQLDGRPWIVLGVLPSGFHFQPRRFVGDPDIFVPLTPNRDRTAWFLRIVARLKPGVSEQQAQAEMNAIAAALAQSYPPEQRRQGIEIDPIHRYLVQDVRQTAFLLVGAVAFVLLIACANVANLLLSRAAARRREIAIRTSVGASRARVIRQLLTESLLLAGLGGTLGVLVALWALPLLIALAPEGSTFFSRVQDTGIQLNSTVLAFTAAVSVLSGLLFGLAPAWTSTQPGGSFSRTQRSGRLRGALLMVQAALSVILLAGAGLMMKSIVRLLDVDPGFRTEKLLTMYVTLPDAKYPTPETQVTFFRELQRRLDAIPGVQSAAAVVNPPLTREYSRNTFETVDDGPRRQGSEMFHSVSPGYFATMGVPIVRGRAFTGADTEHAPAVAVINRALAEKYWPRQDPLGKAILATRGIVERTPEGEHARFVSDRFEIVGVVGDVRQLALDVPPFPELFFPYPQRPSSDMTFVMRTAEEPRALAEAARKAVWALDADQPVSDVKTMDQWISSDLAFRRFVLVLIAAFAFAAVVLAAIGIYGVSSYTVAQRAREIGIRMALGATGKRVVSLVVRQQAVWISAGTAAGVAGGLATARLLSAYLYGVETHDAATFAAVPLVLIGVATAACFFPARRATKVDPSVTLRWE